MADVVIADVVRSPMGKRRGTLSHTQAPDLLGDIYRALMARTGVDPTVIGQVVVGCVNQVGQQSGNIGRNAWLGAGLPESVSASTVHAQCGSSQQATTMAFALVKSGLLDVAVAAGVESMSQVPIDASVSPQWGTGRNERYRRHHEVTSQFEGAERIAEQWGLSRGELDEYGVLSQSRAAAAIAAGHFDDHLVPVEAAIVDETGEYAGTTLFDIDETPRPTTLDGLASLRANLSERPVAFHTAGTSSQIADGAAAMLVASASRAAELGLRPRARIVDSILVGSDPVLMLTGPIVATPALLARNGLHTKDIDVFEINEAFASVVLGWARATGTDLNRVNPNGGAIALGHPLGAGSSPIRRAACCRRATRSGRPARF